MAQYTTREKVMNYLALDNDAVLNASIDEWCIAVSNYIDNVTGRSFDEVADETEEMVFDGSGIEAMIVNDFTEIDEITVDGDVLTSSDYFLYPANDATKNTIELKNDLPRNSRLISQSHFIFPKGQQNIVIKAKWGWDATPEEIILVATKLVGGIIKEAIGDRDVKELTSESLEDYSANYVKISEIAHALKVDDILLSYMIVNPKVARAGLFSI